MSCVSPQMRFVDASVSLLRFCLPLLFPFSQFVIVGWWCRTIRLRACCCADRDIRTRQAVVVFLSFIAFEYTSQERNWIQRDKLSLYIVSCLWTNSVVAYVCFVVQCAAPTMRWFDWNKINRPAVQTLAGAKKKSKKHHNVTSYLLHALLTLYVAPIFRCSNARVVWRVQSGLCSVCRESNQLDHQTWERR